MMQEMHLDFFNNDSRKNIERVQDYGFTSTPIPRSKKEGQQQQSGGSSGNAQPEQPKGEAAEALVMFQGGQRNHPVIVGIDDRRHRPRLLKPGENAQYDDIGQMSLLRRGFAALLSHDGEDYEGNKKERFASLRHVVKKKQERPKSSGASGGGQQQQQEQDFKHEGEQVNTEVRTTAKRIEFRVGDTVVGYYDKENSRWVFIGEVRLGDENADNPIYGVNGGVGMTTKPSGAGAVLVKAPQPGPPTSQDAQP
jgi:phage gp45-like